MNAPLTRRCFLTAGLSAAGGLLIGAAYAVPIDGAPWPADEGAKRPQEIDAFVVVEPDGAILIRIAKSEMGQGVMTSLAMIVAEELECDFAKVKVEYASANRNVNDGGVYQRMGTGGSSSVRRSREMLQQAGASARAHLVAAAAQRWNVKPSECFARDSTVIRIATGEAFGYGELAAEAAQTLGVNQPGIKAPEEFKLIGQRKPRFDTPLKVNGEAQFGIDARVPDMVYAAVVHCPVFGGSVKSYDDKAARARRGVIAVVKVEGGIAVVADRYWRALQALADLKIAWDFGAAGAANSEAFRAEYRAELEGAMTNAVATGDSDAAFKGAAHVVDALYEVPHLAHAPMEPLNATVHWRADRIDIWMGTQFPEDAIKLASSVGCVPTKSVFLHNAFLGGGFGRRAVNDELRQAVQVSQAVGKPVKLIWTREEDIQHDRYRPQAAIRLATALGPDGAPKAFRFKTAVGSIQRSLGWGPVSNGVEASAVEGLVNLPYKTDALRVDCALKNTHVPVMFWRSVGSSQNAFAVESFIDEVAHAAGKDPYAFRRALLVDRPDFLAVLDKLAEKAEWGRPMPKGSAQGISIHESFGTIVGEVAEVAVGDNGDVRVERVVACVDCGHVVNPLTVEMQIESGVLYGLTAALFGEITIRDGRVEQSNFNDYPIAKMADCPVIETHFALSGGAKWGGIGEPGTPPIAPAVANAIFAITGKRIRSLPLKNASLGA